VSIIGNAVKDNPHAWTILKDCSNIFTYRGRVTERDLNDGKEPNGFYTLPVSE